MQSSEKLDVLAKALSGVQGAIEKAVKDSSNPHFKSKYADLETVWDTWQQIGPKAGFAVSQLGGMKDGDPVLYTVLLHESGQWLSGYMPLVAKDAANPQAIVASATYMRRVGLAAMVGIATTDDDGNEAAKPAPAKPEKIKDERGPVELGKSILMKVNNSLTEAELDKIVDHKTYPPTMEAIRKEDRQLWDDIVAAIGKKRSKFSQPDTDDIPDIKPPILDTRMAG